MGGCDGLGDKKRSLGTLERGWSGDSGLGAVLLRGAKPGSGLGGDGCEAALEVGKKVGFPTLGKVGKPN